MKHDFYIDRVRIFLTALVIFHHTAISFGASGGWYYSASTPTTGGLQMFLSFLMGIDQSYFMSLFFFISALFMPRSFDRKGAGKFVKDRIVRLGIPLALYMFLLHPILVYFILGHVGQTPDSFWSFIWYMDTHNVELSTMWFVFSLLIFEFCYVAYRLISPVRLSQKFSDKKPSAWAQIGFMLLFGFIAFAIRLVYPSGKSFYGLQFGYFSLYVGMYLLGIVASRKGWLDKFESKQLLPNVLFALASILIFGFVYSSNLDKMDLFPGGFNLHALFYAMWEPVMCVEISFCILLFARIKLNRPSSKILAAMSSGSFAAYVIHPLVVVGATFLSETLDVLPWAKLVFVLAVSIPASFALSYVIKKTPVLRRIF